MAMYGVTKIEKELIEKGYSLDKTYKINDDAKEKAKNLRIQGYKARVVKETSSVIGLYEYSVWCKR